MNLKDPCRSGSSRPPATGYSTAVTSTEVLIDKRTDGATEHGTELPFYHIKHEINNKGPTLALRAPQLADAALGSRNMALGCATPRGPEYFTFEPSFSPCLLHVHPCDVGRDHAATPACTCSQLSFVTSLHPWNICESARHLR